MPTEDITVIGGMDIPSLGMTKRETMAMHFMAGLLSNPNIKLTGSHEQVAVLMADSLLAELEKING